MILSIVQFLVDETAAGWLLLSTIAQPQRDGIVRRLNAEAAAEKKFNFADMCARLKDCRNDGVAAYSRVHYSSGYVNAFWDDSCFCMTYGDGDGAAFGPLVIERVGVHQHLHLVHPAMPA